MNNFLRIYLDRTFSSSRVLKHSLLSVFYAAIISIFAIFNGFLNDYLLMLIPTLIINEIFIIYACSQKASGVCLSGFCLLNICAALTRAAVNPNSILGTSTFMFFGVLAAMLFGYIQRAFMENHRPIGKLALWFMFISLILCFFMPEVNYTKAWFSIGSGDNAKQLFQLTEFAKFFYILYIGTLFASKPNDKGKVGVSLIVTGIACILLLCINELGTALVIALSYFFLAMIKFKKASSKAIIITSCSLVIILLGLVLWSTSGCLNQWECLSCGTMNSTSKDVSTPYRVCSNCEAHAFTAPCDKKCTKDEPCDTLKYGMQKNKVQYKCSACRSISWDSEKKLPKNSNPTSKNCAICTQRSSIDKKVVSICKKLYDRFSVAYNYDETKAIDSDITLHIDLLADSIKVGHLFGDPETLVDVPTSDTDSIIGRTANLFGVVFSIIALFAFFMIFTAINKANSPLRIITILTFSFQALLSYLGTLNLFALTGIGVPLLSRGGTNLVICYVLVYIMISSIPNKNKEIKK